MQASPPSPELPEINYPKFRYSVPISSQMCGKYYRSLNTLTLFMSSLLLSFVCSRFTSLLYLVNHTLCFPPSLQGCGGKMETTFYGRGGGMGSSAGRRWCLPGRKALGKLCSKQSAVRNHISTPRGRVCGYGRWGTRESSSQKSPEEERPM